MDTFMGTISQLLTCVGPPLCRCIQYCRKLQENVEILKRKLEELNSRKEDIETRLQTECHTGKLLKAEVNTWLRNAERINNEALDIEQKVEKVKCFSRARLGKLVTQKIQEVDGHYQSGDFDDLVIDAPSSSGVVLPEVTLVGKTTAEKIADEIWGYLMGNEVMKIGVCGMGGAGKTTIITSINNKLIRETNQFTNVIWVTVSQPLDLMKVQDRIATALNMNETLHADEDKKIRAGKVLQMLEGKRFVLILDDMWDPFRLEEVGIPKPTEQNGCKLVITTRLVQVCQFMDCKVIKVEPLPDDEALKLFLDQVGDVISRNPNLEEYVIGMVQQCAGLPLAIVTVAGCMKGEEYIGEWRIALEELSQSIKNVRGMETKILGQLQFSYDRLKDEKVQHCFLYCSLYPEDFPISKNKLISYWIAEGLVDERGNMQATYDKGHSILNRLLRNCLLESVDDNGRFVKMHDLVRDMTLELTSQSPMYMIKAGVKLREFLREEEWKGNLEKVSLMWNEISEIPLNLSPNCQTLSTLLLQRNPFESIPESFFVHMPNLTILDLSDTRIRDLPNSISELSCLTTLLLNRCWNLQHVPSLAELSSLWKLELKGTQIAEVPKGIELLDKLRYLALCSSELSQIPIDILHKFFRLKKLSLSFGSETSPATIEEVTKLSELEIFEGHFRNPQDFNLFVQYLDSQGPTSLIYQLFLGSSKYDFQDVEYFYRRMSLWERQISESVGVLEEVQLLEIGLCEDIISLSDVLFFNRLDKEGRLSGKCSDLRVVYMYDCGSLKNLLSPKLLQALQNLEEIYVRTCDDMEEIITSDFDEEGRSDAIKFTFPKLRKLTLEWLPELKSICGHNGVIVCDSLREIQVYRCPELKRLPLSLPLPAIAEINVERDWWESLNWDDPNAKNVLQPYCRWRFFCMPDFVHTNCTWAWTC